MQPTYIIDIAEITHITYITYITHTIYITQILKLIFKHIKKTNKHIFYKFFFYA